MSGAFLLEPLLAFPPLPLPFPSLLALLLLGAAWLAVRHEQRAGATSRARQASVVGATLAALAQPLTTAPPAHAALAFTLALLPGLLFLGSATLTRPGQPKKGRVGA